MSSDSAALWAILGISAIAIVGMGIWYERFRRVPLAEFGMEAVERVLKWEPEARRKMILERGWLTSHEWMTMNRRQLAAIAAEMKRRGIQKDEQRRQ